MPVEDDRTPTPEFALPPPEEMYSLVESGSLSDRVRCLCCSLTRNNARLAFFVLAVS
jgi:hypothetical protein